MKISLSLSIKCQIRVNDGHMYATCSQLTGLRLPTNHSAAAEGHPRVAALDPWQLQSAIGQKAARKAISVPTLASLIRDHDLT